MKGGYFLFNGQFHKESDAVFTLAELSHRASGFVEYFRAEHNEILFLSTFSSYLIATAESAGLDISGEIGPEGRLLRKDVSRLLNKNKLYLAAKIGIQVFPSEDKINVILTAEEIERGYYPLNEPGLLLCFDKENLSENRILTHCSTSEIFIRQGANSQADEIPKGSYALLIGDTIIFPAAGPGGIPCSIQREVIQSAKEVGFQIEERPEINPGELLQADEFFIFDACSGIQKVLGLEDRRYFSPKTKLIAEKLSAMAKMKAVGGS